jgi:hypothetical protein
MNERIAHLEGALGKLIGVSRWCKKQKRTPIILEHGVTTVASCDDVQRRASGVDGTAVVD